MAARISEIFIFKESGKGIFFIKNPNLNEKKSKKSGGVSDFFLQKNPSLKKKIFFEGMCFFFTKNPNLN